MKTKFSIVLCLALTACSTSSLESKVPVFSGYTQKDIDSVNRCLAPKWVELRSSSSSIPTETGYKIIASDDIFGAISTATVDKSKNGGSDVKVYALSKGWNDPWGNAARSCL